LSAEGWALFALVALWQLPHFFAIAWIYRADYAGAGFKMLPRVDGDGRRTARQAVGGTSLLLLASVGPFGLALAGPVYLVGALVLGGAYLACAVQFARHRTEAKARQLFFASILYLPLLLAVLTLDKTR
jgi:protoheme IX farnesyltransferase